MRFPTAFKIGFIRTGLSFAFKEFIFILLRDGIVVIKCQIDLIFVILRIMGLACNVKVIDSALHC